jgi:phosphatidylethanolamine-binding protein (PEBP) family uncharacterized protein
MIKMGGDVTMKRLFFSLILVGILLFAVGCSVEKVNLEVEDGQPEKELSGIDKEIQNLQKELEKSIEEEEEPVKESEDTKETTEKQQEEASQPKETVDVRNLQKLEVMETELVKLKISAQDDDKDAMKYTFSRPLDKNGQWQTSYGDAGEYIISVKVSDSKLTTTKEFVLVVHKKNVAPEIAHLSDITANEGEIIKVKPKVTDVNDDEVSVKISKPIGNDGIWETDYKSAGKYSITITASDGELSSEKTFALKVVDKNVPPKMSGLEDITIKEGETVTIKPKITDLDGDTVKVSISSPVGDDGEWKTGFTDHGEYKIIVSASDGKDSVKQTIMLTVKDVNRAPEILSVELI